MLKMINEKNIWLSSGRTESGDDLPIIMWDGKPSDDEVLEAYVEIYGEEEREYISWMLEEGGTIRTSKS
jgi:hypothetical protein